MAFFTDIFGGDAIKPSDVSYSSITMADTLQLSWESNQTKLTTLTTKIMDLSCSAAYKKVYVADATLVSTGETILFNNIGTYAIEIVNHIGITICNVLPGTAWQLYLTDNSSIGGVWRSVQFGAFTSIANAGVLAGYGIKAIGATLNSAITTQTRSSTATLNLSVNDRAKCYNLNSSTVITVNLPQVTDIDADWFIILRNSSINNVNIHTTSSINGDASIALAVGQSIIILCDGSLFITIGLSSSSTNLMTYESIILTGTTTPYNLTSNNKAGYQVITFTGVLAANMLVVFPSTIQNYYISNATTGAYTLSFGLGGIDTPTTLIQGKHGVFICNGLAVIPADNQAIGANQIVSIAQGGTAAVTANDALANLGGQSTGIALFKSITHADALSSIGTIPVTSGGTNKVGFNDGFLAVANNIIDSITAPLAVSLGGTAKSSFSNGILTVSNTNVIDTIASPLDISHGGSGHTSFSNGIMKAYNGDIISENTISLISNVGGVLPVMNGGTGQTTFTNGIVKVSGNTLSGGGQASLTTEVTGTLPVGSGGTGQTTFTNGIVKVSGNTLSGGAVTLTTDVTGILPIANGGTGNSSGALTIPQSFAFSLIFGAL